MKNFTFRLSLLAMLLSIGLVWAQDSDDDVVRPVKISKAELRGPIFEREDMVAMERFGAATEDVLTFTSSDKKFTAGVYKAGRHRMELSTDEPYGVDEFLYMIEGNMTLTSPDGTVQEFGPGDAVTIPKEWHGIEASDGYVQLWVIYAADGAK